MKKSVTISGLMLLLGIKAFSQQAVISPVADTEFCPNVEQTFTLSSLSNRKPGTSFYINLGLNAPQLVSGFSGSSLPFTFKVKFRDVNIKQSLIIKYEDNNNNPNQQAPLDFTKIKSLFYFSATNCAIIQPTISGGNVFPRCQITTRNITFSNLQYFTEFEVPKVCFSTITTYEYQLPAGWKLGNTVSDGSTWLPGGNNVNVTSTLETGDGLDIRIRPINASCGGSTMMVAAGYTCPIRISRPVPVLAITTANANATFCGGTQRAYQITGVPAGATVLWSFSNQAIASIVGSSTSSNVTLLATTDSGNGVLTATVSPLCGPAIVATSNVTITSYAESRFTDTYKTTPNGAQEFRGYETNSRSSYEWKLDGSIISVGNACYVNKPNCNIQPVKLWYVLQLKVTNDCGATSTTTANYLYNCQTKKFVEQNPPIYYRMAASNYNIYPNPVNNELTISKNKPSVNKTGISVHNELDSEVTNINFSVAIYDDKGKQVKTTINNLGEPNIILNTQNIPNGIYFLHIKEGNETIKKQIIIQH